MRKPLLSSSSSAAVAADNYSVNPNPQHRTGRMDSDSYSNNSNHSNIEKLRHELHRRVQTQDDDGTRTISAFQYECPEIFDGGDAGDTNAPDQGGVMDGTSKRSTQQSGHANVRKYPIAGSDGIDVDEGDDAGVSEKIRKDQLQQQQSQQHGHRSNRPQTLPPPEPNIIVTGRYNIITFFPQSLFEQFRRLANVYFLILGTIAAIGQYTDLYLTAVDAEGILTPMITVVLISVIKDGIEDIKRHRADSVINKKKTHIVTKDEEVREVEWATLVPGSIVLLCNGDELPADIVVLACGGIQGKTCYVETAAIDGETNLKPRLPCIADAPTTNTNAASSASLGGVDIQVVTTYASPTPAHPPTSMLGRLSTTASPPTSPTGSVDGLPAARRRVTGVSNMSLSVLVENPTEIIDGFNGSVTYSTTSMADDSMPVTNTLIKDNLLLRGSVLRATEWCVGMVVYTGKETKISMNSKKAPSKLSSVDRIVNNILAIAILSMIIVCLVSMVLGILWIDDNSEAYYLCLQKDAFDSMGFSHVDGGGCTSKSAQSALTVFTFATLYNNFVCISMYVSLEMVYLCQAYFIANDLTIYDETTDTPAECHSSGMCADLGQIQYVMSDKTGTLTKNMMKLRRISVAGMKYGEPISLAAPISSKTAVVSAAASALLELEPADLDGQGRASFGLIPDIRSSLGLLPGYHKGHHGTASSVGGPMLSNDGGTSLFSNSLRTSETGSNIHGHRTSIGSSSVTGGNYPVAHQQNPAQMFTNATEYTNQEAVGVEDQEEVWYPLEQLSAVNRLVTNAPAPIDSWSQQDRTVFDFVRVLVSCNTCIIMPDDQGATFINDVTSLKKHLQAESPDEVALVLAAAEFSGTLLVKREGNVQTIVRTDSATSGPRTVNGSGAATLPAGSPVHSSVGSGTAHENTETIEVLAVNGFDSDRKRMSVLVRVTENNSDSSRRDRYLLLVKGADSSLIPLCHEGLWSSECLEHIESFASTGLRTLVMAQKELAASEAQQWLAEYRVASKSVVKRRENMTAVATSIEKGLELLGAVGIEDELQDGVPDAIRMLLLAGLNVWMITGDKPETAVAISHQCGLLSNDHEIEKVIGLSGEALRQRILDLHGYLEGRQSIMGNSSVDRDAYSFSIASPDVASKRHGSSSRSSSFGFTNPSHGDKYITSVVRPTHIASVSCLGGAAGALPPTAAITAPTATAAVASKKKIALIVDGTSLEALWALPDLKKRFTEAVRSVPTVIACRVSPKQKAALVRMIKTGAGSPITLAIGDGANDVGMIHEARVGVGIAGREGRHAANSSDFAIGQFRFLVPLILEHGRFNYIRCSKLVLYSFFKNLVLVSVLFYFCIYSGYSGTVPLDSIVFSGYNFYLGLPIIALGALDFDVPRLAVNRYPFLAYSTGRLGEMLNLGTMFRWCLTAFLQGMLLFVVTTRMITGDDTVLESDFTIRMNGPGGLNTSSGHPTGLFVFGYMMYTVTFVAMQYKVLAMTTSRTWINWTLWILSFMGYFLFTYVYGLFDSMDWFRVAPMAFDCPTYWLAILVCPIILALSDMCFEMALSKFFPTSQDNLVQVLHLEELLRKKQQRMSGNLQPLQPQPPRPPSEIGDEGDRGFSRVMSGTSTASSWWQDHSSSNSGPGGLKRQQALREATMPANISVSATAAATSMPISPSSGVTTTRESRLSSSVVTNAVSALASSLTGRNSSGSATNMMQQPLLAPASLMEQEEINGVSFGVGDPTSSPSSSTSTTTSMLDSNNAGLHMRALSGALGSGQYVAPTLQSDDGAVVM